MNSSELNGHAVGPWRAYFSRDFNLSLKNVGFISPFVRLCLRKVYISLCLFLAFGSLGSYLDYVGNIGGLTTILVFVVSLALFRLIPPRRERNRVALLIVAAFCQGTFTGLLINLFISIDESIIFIGLAGAAMSFGCFAVGAALEPERSSIYFFGILSSNLVFVLCLIVAFAIYGGATSLLWENFCFQFFLGYLVAYSQHLVVQARRRNFYYSHHSLTFFTDIPAVCYYLSST